MEILSNFASIYCYISFVIEAVLMLVALAIVAMGKDNNEPRNKIHFYVTCELYYHDKMTYTLWIGKPYYNTEYRCFKSNTYSNVLAMNETFVLYKLNYSDFADMKVGEIREVFLNLED